MAITQTIPLYSGTVPNRSQGATEFRNNADDWLAYQAPLGAFFNTYASQANSTAATINDQASQVAVDASTAVGAAEAATTLANFKGQWSSLTGALNIPASVYHKGNYWALLSNTSNVALIEPGVSTQWAAVPVYGRNLITESVFKRSLLSCAFDANTFREYESPYGLEPKQLTDVMTTARSTTGTRINPLGTVETIGANIARIEYDPATGECLGLLAEAQATNLLLYNSQFDNAIWGKIGCTVAPNAAIAPDGTLSGDKIVEAASAGNKLVRQSYVSSSGSYSATLSLKASGRNFARLLLTDLVAGQAAADVNLITGEVTIVAGFGSWTNVTVDSDKRPDAWVDVFVSGTQGAGTEIRFQIFVCDTLSSVSYTGDGTSGILVWGAQLETGLVPTSRITTAASQVTRNADNPVRSNQIDTIARSCTIFCEIDVKIKNTTTPVPVISYNDVANTGNRALLHIAQNAAGGFQLTQRNSIDSTGVGVDGNNIPTGKHRVAAVYNAEAGTLKIAADGNLSSTVAALDPETFFGYLQLFPTQISGVSSGNRQRMYIARAEYFPRALSDSELIALTAV